MTKPPKPGKLSPNKIKIKIICISDTHNAQPSLPSGTILLHAGDLTENGTFAELQAQLTWLSGLNFQHKIVVAGNHDRLLDPEFVARQANPMRKFGGRREDLRWGDVRYMDREGISVSVGGKDGGKGRVLKFWGSPMTRKREVGGVFRYRPKIDVWEERIPRGTDVVVCHQPMKGVCDDGGKGCRFLREELRKVRPKLVICGHLHGGFGREVVRWDKGSDGKKSGVGGWMAWLLGMGDRRRDDGVGKGGKKRRERTEVVNAALKGGEEREAVIVYL